MSPHSDTLSRFRANQSLLFLFNAVCLAEKQHILMLVFGLIRSRLKPTIYHTRGEHSNHYTTDSDFHDLNLNVYPLKYIVFLEDT
jgi:hypothetical protein